MTAFLHLGIVASTVLACAGDGTGPQSGTISSDGGLYLLDVQMSPDPPVAGPATLTVTVTEAATDQVVGDASLAVDPWMPEHGHGLSEAPVVDGQAGVFTASFAYTMPGAWELRFDLDGSPGADTAAMSVEVE